MVIILDEVKMQELKSFEEFIIKCCEMDEWDLRDFLRQILGGAGFSIKEDDYKSHRGGRYQEIHNMLAIRGNKPKICLVAHTDVCRDHNYRGIHIKANPIIKEMDRFGEKHRIIQDKNCKVQVGGDDRLGVAINTWVALNTGYDMGLLFTTDEEIGNQSADYASFPELIKFELCAQVDRGNHSNQLVTNIGGVKLCSNEITQNLLQLAEDIGLPRTPVIGLMTDVLALTQNKMIKNAVNMTCGYHSSISSSPNEYISIKEATDTLAFVNEIIKSYEVETIEDFERRRLEKDELENNIATAKEADFIKVIWN